MPNGVTAELTELIAFQRFAKMFQSNPRQKIIQSTGNHLSKRRGRGMDFSEVRNYQAGDEIRHMEWRVTARTGKPHIKLYQEEREQPIILVVDFSPSMFFGTQFAFKSVVAARLSAMIAWTTIKQGDWIGGLFFSAKQHNEYTPKPREKGVLPLLSALSEYTHQKPEKYKKVDTLSKALQRLNRVARPGSIFVLISDFYGFNEECIQSLMRLRPHNDILAYHICDPLELSPPKPERYAISDGQEELLLDTTFSEISESYAQFCTERIATLKESFKRLQMPYTAVTPLDDIPRVVYTTFPRKKNV